VKNSYFLLLFSLVGFIYSCSETQEKDESFKTSVTLTSFNDFIPSYVYEVPNLEIEPGSYFNRLTGKYNIDALVDSIHANAVYWKIKDSRENTIYQGPALDGKKNGWWEVFKNEVLVCCGNYQSGKKNGFWRYFKLINDSKKYVTYKNDTLNGLSQELSIDSILLSQGKYSNGLKSDYWKFFYNNGKIKEQGYFYESFKSGWWQSFESNGNLIEEASYSRNEISGYIKKYLKGILFEEGNFYNGKRRGTWKCYYENGKLKSIKEYDK